MLYAAILTITHRCTTITQTIPSLPTFELLPSVVIMQDGLSSKIAHEDEDALGPL